MPSLRVPNGTINADGLACYDQVVDEFPGGESIGRMPAELLALPRKQFLDACNRSSPRPAEAASDEKPVDFAAAAEHRAGIMNHLHRVLSAGGLRPRLHADESISIAIGGELAVMELSTFPTRWEVSRAV